MRFPLVSAFALLLLPLLSGAVIVDDFQALPATEYDFVIVGGGTAGCVMANRLSENPLHNILLIEAGPNGEGVLNLSIPAYNGRFGPSEYDWGYKTVPQPGLNNRTDVVPRGFVLGGSSSINGMVYTRGSADDYNRWANLTGDAGWAWDNLLPYFLKSEKWTLPADNHDIRGEYDPAFHSTEGIVGVSLPGYPQAIDATLLEAAQEVGYPFDLDMNDGVSLGIGWEQMTVANGTRSSSAFAYLASPYASRANLHVVVNHRATKLIQKEALDYEGSTIPDFRTVTFSEKDSTTSYNVTAAREVILSAGSIGTPQLLLLSGIGDAVELEDAGIQPTVDLPSVGKNLTEHPTVSTIWNVTRATVIDVSQNQTYQEEVLNEWQVNRTGPLTNFGFSLFTWSRLPDAWPGWAQHGDPSSGSNSPHLETLSLSPGGAYPLPGPIIVSAVVLLTPTSRGTVKLNTTDLLGDPLIDLGLLTSDFDIRALRQGIAEAKEIFSAQAWAGWGLELTGPLSEATSDEQVDEAIRNLASNTYHPVSTAMMTPEDASYGVVNPDLRVKKVSGLRVVDASIMPHIPTGHTQAPVYAIAERAADIVKAHWAA
ncbi:aryl-alcohol oxidase [Coprinopsis sp. MPI-PUGE-AT-0042]|nr:aryl-alcohol oxidase [Coprinopsis sp. MPI-PUGE-AT-0042]